MEVTTQAHEGIETNINNLEWTKAIVTTQAHEGIETGAASADNRNSE